ncbi:NAC transcription factor [Striga asiatica]|uniref:NAC transcription factor n=1 Tax=Striga asiatica TaxID=4170 RepID=A0A5A7PKH1_STRAF|nr:NAC transcription factor [Striga asiatica]
MAAPVDNYPMGVRFHPTDEECCRYLIGAVTGNPIAGDHLIISTADLFGEKEPWEFFSPEDEHQERYFYTRLKRIAKNNNNSNNQRFSRNIGNGTWSNKGQRAFIHGERGELLGHKRTFRYVARKECCSSADFFGEWFLKEYTVPDCKLGQVKAEFKDYVLCLLRRKKNKKKRKSGPGRGLGESGNGPGPDEGGLAYLLSTLGDQSRPADQGYSGNLRMDVGSVVPSDGVCWVNGNPVGLWESSVDDVDLEDDNLGSLISFDMDDKDLVWKLENWFGGSCGAMSSEECFMYPMWG